MDGTITGARRPAGGILTLTGLAFVLLTALVWFVLSGSTPDGDATTQKVVSFYTDHRDKQMIMAMVWALGAVALAVYGAVLREALVEPGRELAGTIVMIAATIAATGVLLLCGVHFALADLTHKISPASAQALNALDSDLFVPMAAGFGLLVLAVSLASLRVVAIMPRWMAWAGVVLGILCFTPVGWFALLLSMLGLGALSVMLYLRTRERPATAAPRMEAPAAA